MIFIYLKKTANSLVIIVPFAIKFHSRERGFGTNWFINYCKSQSGDLYLLCYEYGFL